MFDDVFKAFGEATKKAARALTLVFENGGWYVLRFIPDDPEREAYNTIVRSQYVGLYLSGNAPGAGGYIVVGSDENGNALTYNEATEARCHLED